MVVNGKTWPFLDVEPRRYRFRLLNGCQAALPAPLVQRPQGPGVADRRRGRLPAGPGAGQGTAHEPGRAGRRDRRLLRWSSRAPRSSCATPARTRPSAAVASGPPTRRRPVRSCSSTSPCRLVGTDTSTPPAQLVMPAAPSFTPTTVTRSAGAARDDVHVARGATDPGRGPTRHRSIPAVGLPTGVTAQMWMEPVTENPAVGASETWEFYNFTADAHPIHIHEVFFEVVNRQRLDKKTGLPIKTPRPPEPTENGYKDTVIAYPGEVTRVRMASSSNAGPVRLALPYRRARGQRDDAAVSGRAGCRPGSPESVANLRHRAEGGAGGREAAGALANGVSPLRHSWGAWAASHTAPRRAGMKSCSVS